MLIVRLQAMRMEDEMSGSKANLIYAVALCLIAALAAPAEAMVSVRHHHHHYTRGNPNFDPYAPLIMETPGASYNGGGVYTGEGFSRSSGGVNSMSNDFGTSGVLGHTNGQPSLPH
jgi:hypothetical protein